MSGSGRVLVATLLVALVSCGGADVIESEVRGRVVDVQDGAALVGVRVEGPRGVRAVTDPRGRFVLTGLNVGDEGVVRAWRSDGWEAEVAIRPLLPEGLEVVLHLSP